eukprot:8321951-Ditylum_brightwellii.AAC.1
MGYSIIITRGVVNKLSTQLGVLSLKMSTFSTKEMKSEFPHKLLSCIDREPNNEQIHTLMMELHANAAAIPTTLGGGVHCHIGL